MPNLPETPVYDEGVYQIETTDAVVGGVGGVSNAASINLANRTAYLKVHVDGRLVKSVAGSADVVLTAAEAVNGILEFTGVLTGNISVIVPTSPTRSWIVKNGTTGAYTLTVKTVSGSGVLCTQGKNAVVYTDGANVYDALTDFDSPALTGNPTAPTAPQFDNDISIATTAFVQRALGNFSAYKSFNVSTVLTADDYGKSIVPFGTGPVAVTLPAISASHVGGCLNIWTNNTNAAGVTIGAVGADTIIVGNASTASINIKPGDSLILVNSGGQWIAIGGSTSLEYAEAFKTALNDTGLQHLPSKLMFKWATVVASATPGAALAINFPTAFPTACLGIVLTGVTSNTANAAAWHSGKSASGFNLHAALANQSVTYFAWGK